MGAAEDTAESGELKQLKYYRNMHRAAEANCKLSATVMLKLQKFCIKLCQERLENFILLICVKCK